ncbi:DUF4365 domain-containing protein [Anatilimnocola sp. NA78]|uniref:DUF4365 domain-containing protein n=1 Tax=Anatilimnocola sp. NA78 TaxID=3415683 RepID=UPI003CE59BE9
MLTIQNIESELSYAYLHAIASQAGFECTCAGRHLDNACIDAIIREDGRRLAADSKLTSFEVHVQLKATFQIPTEQDGKYSFSLEIPHYNKLRHARIQSPRLLVVMYLPSSTDDWLSHSEDGLISKRCAYWVSLRNAPDSSNMRTQTVYIPRKQMLSSLSLSELMTRFSRREEINYAN